MDLEGGQRFGRARAQGCRACGLSAGSGADFAAERRQSRRGAERGSHVLLGQRASLHLCLWVSDAPDLVADSVELFFLFSTGLLCFKR